MAVPYVARIKQEDLNKIYITDSEDVFDEKFSHIAYIPSINGSLPQFQLPMLTPLTVTKKENTEESQLDYVYQVVYPTQVQIPQQQPLKRGRKKKKKVEEPQIGKNEPIKNLKPPPRTRSGRIIKFPKHMEKDFKKVETKDTKKSLEDNAEIETTDFAVFKEEPCSKPTELPQLDFHQRRRKVASQYRCPTCLKAYLGKTKMIQHIKKNPDHGPLPQKENSKVNFEVWNYLVDITNKCTPAQRGIKFCEELTNLLHNVLLLTSALFKKVEQNKNFVEVDKVLGNAIGLTPGFYTFNESELYKDVTVLKLITTTDFFKPVDSKESHRKDEEVNNAKGAKIEDIESESILVNEIKVKTKLTNQEDLRKTSPNYCITQIEPKIATDLGDMPDDYEKKEEISSHIGTELLSDNSLLQLPNIRNTVEELMLSSDVAKIVVPEPIREETNKSLRKPVHPCFSTQEDLKKTSPNYCITHIDLPTPKIATDLGDYEKKDHMDSDLLSDHSLLHLSNIRNSVEELMLSSVDPGGTLLDNSTSSDEVMNVDQFVNERFKKITEPDLEMATASLNIDLPPLDLFQFHTT